MPLIKFKGRVWIDVDAEIEVPEANVDTFINGMIECERARAKITDQYQINTGTDGMTYVEWLATYPITVDGKPYEG